MQILTPETMAAEVHLQRIYEYMHHLADCPADLASRIASIAERTPMRGECLRTFHRLTQGDPIAIDELVRNAHARLLQTLPGLAREDYLRRNREVRGDPFCDDVQRRAAMAVRSDVDAEDVRFTAEVENLAKLPASRAAIRLAGIEHERGQAVRDRLEDGVTDHLRHHPDHRPPEPTNVARTRRQPVWQLPARAGDGASVDSDQAQLI